MSIRTFEGGGARDTAQGKLHPYGFIHPWCDHSFNKYMDYHRLQTDGSLRDPDNWWNGWDRKISLDCLARHVEDLKCLHAGLYVYKERRDGGEITHVLDREPEVLPEGWVAVTEEEACNAVRFNSDAYKLEVLKKGELKLGRTEKSMLFKKILKGIKKNARV